MPSLCACGKSASLSHAGEETQYCSTCKSPSMVDVTNKKSIDCNVIQACFKCDDEKPKYCATCKLPNMIDVNNKNMR